MFSALNLMYLTMWQTSQPCGRISLWNSSESLFLDFCDCLEGYAHSVACGFRYFCFFGTVSRNMLISDFGEVPESLFFLGVGTVSMNMLTSWSMWALVLLFFPGQSRRIFSRSTSERFRNLCWFFVLGLSQKICLCSFRGLWALVF